MGKSLRRLLSRARVTKDEGGEKAPEKMSRE